MLPYDYTRCNPTTLVEKCTSCARWSGHPNQTWGRWTPITRYNPSECDMIPDKEYKPTKETL